MHAAELSSGIYPFLLEVMHRTAARAGLEIRYPFFDRRLMDFCVALPPKQKLRDGWTRATQRFAMSDRLPATVVWRTGKGNLGPVFGRNLYLFEGQRLAEWISGPLSELSGFVDRGSLRAAYQRFATTGGNDEALRIWNAWTAASWLRSAGMV
jgi:asparagine synthase (glutamine-hydrolysing)